MADQIVEYFLDLVLVGAIAEDVGFDGLALAQCHHHLLTGLFHLIDEGLIVLSFVANARVLAKSHISVDLSLLLLNLLEIQGCCERSVLHYGL